MKTKHILLCVVLVCSIACLVVFHYVKSEGISVETNETYFKAIEKHEESNRYFFGRNYISVDWEFGKIAILREYPFFINEYNRERSEIYGHTNETGVIYYEATNKSISVQFPDIYKISETSAKSYRDIEIRYFALGYLKNSVSSYIWVCTGKCDKGVAVFTIICDRYENVACYSINEVDSFIEEYIVQFVSVIPGTIYACVPFAKSLIKANKDVSIVRSEDGNCLTIYKGNDICLDVVNEDYVMCGGNKNEVVGVQYARGWNNGFLEQYAYGINIYNICGKYGVLRSHDFYIGNAYIDGEREEDVRNFIIPFECMPWAFNKGYTVFMINQTNEMCEYSILDELLDVDIYTYRLREPYSKAGYKSVIAKDDGQELRMLKLYDGDQYIQGRMYIQKDDDTCRKLMMKCISVQYAEK